MMKSRSANNLVPARPSPKPRRETTPDRKKIASGGEGRIALILCVLAALRVFVFSAAFPFFTNVDEQSHVDLVSKYARGHVPAGLRGRTAGIGTVADGIGICHNHSRPWPAVFRKCKDTPALRPAG